MSAISDDRVKVGRVTVDPHVAIGVAGEGCELAGAANEPDLRSATVAVTAGDGDFPVLLGLHAVARAVLELDAAGGFDDLPLVVSGGCNGDLIAHAVGRLAERGLGVGTDMPPRYS